MQQDAIAQIKEKASLYEVIKACGVGKFTSASSTQRFRGHHGTHAEGNKQSCLFDPVVGRWKCFVCGQHGDVIEWVLSVKFDGQLSRFSEAIAWLANYYDLEVSDTLLDLPKYKIYRVLTQLADKWHQNLLGNPEKLEWVMEKWGLNEETINQLCLGYCDGVTNLDIEIDHTTLISAGVIDDTGNQPLMNRIVFPYFRNGQVVWMSGRKPYDTGDDAKYTNLRRSSEVRPTLYNYDMALNKKHTEAIVFTEGLGDAAKAHQEGLRCVAVGGAQSYARVIEEDLKPLLKACSGYRFIIFDSEESGVGASGAAGFAKGMLSCGFDPLIVNLPRKKGVDKVDLASFLMDNDSDKVAPLFEESLGGKGDKLPRTLPNILIDALPKMPERHHLHEIISATMALSHTDRNRYLGRLSKVTNTSMADLKNELKFVEKKAAKTDFKMTDYFEEAVYYAQDFRYIPEIDFWKAHTTIFVPYRETVTIGQTEQVVETMRPTHITVDLGPDNTFTVSQDLERFPDEIPEQVKERIPDRQVLCERSNRWSIASDKEYSFANFVSGKVKNVDVGELYKDIVRLFTRFVYFERPEDMHLCALYIMWTYIYMGYDATPYLQFVGEANTGKSTAATLIAELAFNSVIATNMSSAVMFRLAHATRPTMIITEADALKSPRSDSAAYDLQEVCLGGYGKQEGFVRRIGTDKFEAQSFFCYGPKVFAGNHYFRKALASRCITLEMKTIDVARIKELQDWTSERVYIETELQSIRDRLRIWGLTQFRLVRNAFGKVEKDVEMGFVSRTFQIWQPLMAIADLVEEVGGVPLKETLLEGVKYKILLEKRKVREREFATLVISEFYKQWYVDKEALGHYVRRGREDAVYFCPAIAIAKLTEIIHENKLWSNLEERFDAPYLCQIIRNAGAMSQGTTSLSARMGGKIKNVYPIDIEAVEAYLDLKGVVLNDLRSDLGEDADSGPSDVVLS